MNKWKRHPGFFYTEYPDYLIPTRPEDEEMDIERCPQCGWVVSECICNQFYFLSSIIYDTIM